MTIEGSILRVTVANPPVNALSQIERQGLIDAMVTANVPEVRAVIIDGADDVFIAGADVREFGQPPLPPHLPDVVAAIEGCPKPVIAAIARQALGGGLEIALGCHYRVVAEGTKLGLPEVTLGIVPGAGGTQRLPRLIDPLLAATMISSGKPITAAKALEVGLADIVVPRTKLISAATALAEEKAGQDIGARRLSLRPAPDRQRHGDAFAKLTADTKRSARGAKAPAKALELVEAALSVPFAEGLLKERETFLDLRGSAEAAALRHIFLAERAAAKPPANIGAPKVLPIAKIGVIGAGTMGTGIAQNLADSGLQVVLIEQAQDALDRGLARISEAYSASAAKGRISEAQGETRISAISGAVDYAALAECDLVIEAAFEAMEVKRAIFAELDRVVKPGAILATNTSYLDIEAIADGISRPEAVIGLHYFSPANVMKLLEIVSARRTSPEAIATALAFAKRTSKTAVVAGVCNGFIGNRMLRAYTREAGLLLLEGATPEQVDEALTTFGMAMGPFAVSDMSGIDIAYKARQQMPAGIFEREAVLVHDGLAENGMLGRKAGAGFYRYESGKPMSNPLVADLIKRARSATGIVPRTIMAEEIVERCALALANEGGVILDEGVAQCAGDIDVVWINGYGFPRHRGGPMHFANAMGRETYRERVAGLRALRGGRWAKWWQKSHYWEDAPNDATPPADRKRKDAKPSSA